MLVRPGKQMPENERKDGSPIRAAKDQMAGCRGRGNERAGPHGFSGDGDRAGRGLRNPHFAAGQGPIKTAGFARRRRRTEPRKESHGRSLPPVLFPQKPLHRVITEICAFGMAERGNGAGAPRSPSSQRKPPKSSLQKGSPANISLSLLCVFFAPRRIGFS